MTTKIRHVFFDLDNTLWDFRKNSECALIIMYKNFKVEENRGVPFKKFHDFYYNINESLWEDFRDNKITKEDLRQRRFPEAFQKAGIPDLKLAETFEKIYFEEIVKFNHLVEDSDKVLSYLKEKYTVHVLTNGFEKVSKRKIFSSNVHKYIETWTSAEEIGTRKPDPKIFEHALKKAGVNKPECIYIGDDWIADAIGATNFGMKAIYFNPLKLNYKKEGVIVIEKLIELKELL